MKIALIVLNFNKKDLLKNCLESLENLAYHDYSVIVVDNGSTDGSIELVKNQFKRITLLEVGWNSGFCKGNNIGITYAINQGFEAIAVLNNDIEVVPNFLTSIVDAVDIKNKFGMISTKVVLFKNPQIIDALGFMITPDGLGKNLGAGEAAETAMTEREVFCPTGAATFYCKELLEDIKQENEYYDEDFEYCYEELDLGWRARLRGWKCRYAPNAIAYHHKSATAGGYSKSWAYYSNRNIFFNIIKNYPSLFYLSKALFLSFARYIILLWGLIVHRGVGFVISENIGAVKTAKIFIRSIINSMRKWKKMVIKRKYIQRRKKINEDEIKRWFSELGHSFNDSIFRI